MTSRIEQLETVAQLDQFGAILAGMAGVMGQYLRALRAAGMTEQEAFEIVAEFHRMYWDNALNKSNGNPNAVRD